MLCTLFENALDFFPKWLFLALLLGLFFLAWVIVQRSTLVAGTIVKRVSCFFNISQD